MSALVLHALAVWGAADLIHWVLTWVTRKEGAMSTERRKRFQLAEQLGRLIRLRIEVTPKLMEQVTPQQNAFSGGPVRAGGEPLDRVAEERGMW